MTINKVILIGRLGNDPEIRMTPSGHKVAAVSLATSRKFKNNQGQRVEETEWHHLSLFSRLAEIIEQYTTRGSQIYVEGRLKTSQWTDQNGQTRYSTQVIVENLQLLDRAPNGR